MSAHGHRSSGSVSQNHKAQLANAYNELGKELASNKIRVVGNYTLGKVIGEGTYGKVRLGTHRLSSTRVAIKQIPKAMSAALTREIHHHRQLHHPHIAQMYEVIATESSIWIVTELCCGGELFDYLVEKGRLTEEETRVIFGQLCLAVAYLHEAGIVHRDLKLENVLLDEHCRVKLGDFGFTREFDKNALMETFCGTTGYASPEMLQGKKYQGPEVDVWSLGVILYCLLTGTLPFDDDDELAMRAKIIKGDYDDPSWLSLEARDLINKILQKDVTKRFTIPQILTHPWFTSRKSTYETQPPLHDEPMSEQFLQSSPSSTQPDLSASTPTPSDNILDDPFLTQKPTETQATSYTLPRTSSDSTIGRASATHSLTSKVITDHIELTSELDNETPIKLSPFPQPWSKAPQHPVRTPARTKRRSVSSTMSSPSPTTEKSPSTPLPTPITSDLDFASLLSQPTPIIFSTPIERELLNSLSSIGFDTGQVVHSVLENACDSAGALWWMMKKKAEKRASDVVEPLISTDLETPRPRVIDVQKHMKTVGVQTLDNVHIHLANSAPQLAFVPPTPTTIRPTTPPRYVSPTRSPLLSPSSSTVAENSVRSHPSTPGGSVKDKEKRKARSGSVSIMQRATTALEAAGLVRKKSSEVVKEKEEKERDKSKDEPRSSHGSGGSSKLTKSPPLKPSKDKDHPPVPVTPPPGDKNHSVLNIGSPWVLPDIRDSLQHKSTTAVTSSTVSGQIQNQSAPNIAEVVQEKPTGATRPRANLLTAFRLWFHEDRKGKRKEAVAGNTQVNTNGRQTSQPLVAINSAKRRDSNFSNKYASRTSAPGHRAQRPSMSSRRSSSVNSRRSSGASMHMVLVDSPQITASRRSFGSHTPNSERGEFSSRPSSIRSVSMQPRHRKSPSASSISSTHFRTASPMQKYHRRGGSGSSTRVVRQVPSSRVLHIRNNSATSSIHSPPSSRPGSFYEASEGDASRTGSPLRTRKRSGERMATGNSVFVQKRPGPFMSPMNSHGFSMGRSSWKRSWGLEPPGWQTRTTHLPIEVLSISPAVADQTTIRDVFSVRQSLNLGSGGSGAGSGGDESDWVDEDEDIPAFAGGLGQLGTSSKSLSLNQYSSPSLIDSAPAILSPPPKGNRNRSSSSSSNKRTNRTTASNNSSCSNTALPPISTTIRQKTSNERERERERITPVQQETAVVESRTGRRQLPTARSGPAFRQAIQEEDEDEEEE